MAVHLGVNFVEYEYSSDPMYMKLYKVIGDWKASQDHPTVGRLLAACREAKVGPKAREALMESSSGAC